VTGVDSGRATRYRCHLTYRYAASWAHRKGEIIIEVYDVGSREKGPT
jgi:hypothetical protein